jgi:hypothetical protein
LTFSGAEVSGAGADEITGAFANYFEIKKSKTVNFYCIVDYAHWGHHIKKKRTLLLYLCGGVEKNKKYKNKRNSRFLHAVTTKLLI